MALGTGMARAVVARRVRVVMRVVARILGEVVVAVGVVAACGRTDGS